MTSCNTLRRQQQSRVIGQIVVWLNKSIRVWHRLMFGVGGKARESKTLLGLSNCEIVCRTACLCVCHSVCMCVCCAAAAVERCNNISGAKQLICQMSALYHHIVRLGSCPSLPPLHTVPPARGDTLLEGRHTGLAFSGKRITHSGIFGGSLHTVRGARELSLFLCEIFEAMRNQSSDAIPTGTRERQTSLICIFCSFLREEKNKREREWMKETQKESCGRQAARKTDWQSNLKLHP